MSSLVMANETIGQADFQVGTDTYHTWYKVLGILKSSTRRPLVLVHGGPACTHRYFQPIKTVYTEANIPLVFYDQIGCGRSSPFDDVRKENWTMELFINELENLLKHLEIEDFDLFGQGWGAVISTTFAAGRNPKGLKHLILGSPGCSAKMYEDEIYSRVIPKLPEELVNMMRKHESAGTTDTSEEYQAAKKALFRKQLCALDPWPDYVEESFSSMMGNPSMWRVLRGPHIFRIRGVLGSDWDLRPILHKISSPTLIFGSPKETSQIQPMVSRIPKVKWIEMMESTRLVFIEETERFISNLLQFIESSEPVSLVPEATERNSNDE